MATPDSADALAYMMEGLKDRQSAINQIYETTGLYNYLTYTDENGITDIDKYKSGIKIMSCYRLRERMQELRRCGCRQCFDEYRQLERDSYDYNSRNYYVPIEPPRLTALTVDKITPELEKKMNTEEPKNVAVKTLVDKLKVEQAGLTSTKATIEIYKTQRKTADDNIKTQNKYKTDKEKAIKELSVALKKLGHKE